MKQTTKKANVVNNSNNVATVANVENLAPVQIDDATTTKGKATAKFNLNDQTEAEANLEKVDKNQLFSVELSDYFCPVKFEKFSNSKTTCITKDVMKNNNYKYIC